MVAGILIVGCTQRTQQRDEVCGRGGGFLIRKLPHFSWTLFWHPPNFEQVSSPAVPALSPAEATSPLRAFVATPAGFTFTELELGGWDGSPRVVHNNPLLDFARAQVLATRSRTLRSATYPAVVLQVREVNCL